MEIWLMLILNFMKFISNNINKKIIDMDCQEFLIFKGRFPDKIKYL